VSVVSINNADSRDPRSRPAKAYSLATNLSAVVRWKGFQFEVNHNPNNLSVDLGYHVYRSKFVVVPNSKAGLLK